MKEMLLILGPVGLYFLAKLLRYWLLVREDKCAGDYLNIGDRIIIGFYFLCFILTWPISLAGAGIDMLYAQRTGHIRDESIRFVRSAIEMQNMTNAERRKHLMIPNDNWHWTYPGWIEENCRKYGIDKDDLFVSFTSEDYEYNNPIV